MNDPPQPESRLARRLGTFDAVVIGLGAMIGAGVFAAIGPAAAAAGGGLLIGLGIAAVVAYCNATSSARLAALYPHSGGTYVYGRERLGPAWGFLAGWALRDRQDRELRGHRLDVRRVHRPRLRPPSRRRRGRGAHRREPARRPTRDGARQGDGRDRPGVHSRSSLMSSATSSPSVSNIGPLDAGGIRGTLEAAALLFFAFAGYTRIATLGDEVRDPVRTIPRAIPIALGITPRGLRGGGVRSPRGGRPRRARRERCTPFDGRGSGHARLGRACGARRRNGRLARGADVAAARRQPHAVRDGRRGRPSALARCGPCRPTACPITQSSRWPSR